jgi:hypothetical protein
MSDPKVSLPERLRLGESIGAQVTRADGTVEPESKPQVTINQALLLLAKAVVAKLLENENARSCK